MNERTLDAHPIPDSHLSLPNTYTDTAHSFPTRRKEHEHEHTFAHPHSSHLTYPPSSFLYTFCILHLDTRLLSSSTLSLLPLPSFHLLPSPSALSLHLYLYPLPLPLPSLYQNSILYIILPSQGGRAKSVLRESRSPGFHLFFFCPSSSIFSGVGVWEGREGGGGGEEKGEREKGGVE